MNKPLLAAKLNGCAVLPPMESDRQSSQLGAKTQGAKTSTKKTAPRTTGDHFATINEVYGARFPSDPPARATYAVAGLPRGVDVEIEAIAVY